MNYTKKKAFTLTELLVVVVVIGVLSAVVLPKFNKVMETRKTTEAEEMMAAVRTEQERRCALDKNYLKDLSKMSDIIPNTDTKNFTYVATATGIKAYSKGKYGYTLEMPSYRDGRLCCDSDECAKLNKDYPSCSALVASADYLSGEECQADEAEETNDCTGARPSNTQACPNGCGTQSRTVTCDLSSGQWVTGEWTGSCECACRDTEPSSTQSCPNGCGTQTRPVECDTSTGEWQTGEWSGACTCQCLGEKPGTVQECNKCGMQTRTVTCDTSTGQWTAGEWSECSKQEEDCCVPGRVYLGPAGGQSDTCDGDDLALFDESGLSSAVKKVCYDVYRVQYFTGGTSGCSGAAPVCSPPKKLACHNGNFVCVDYSQAGQGSDGPYTPVDTSGMGQHYKEDLVAEITFCPPNEPGVLPGGGVAEIN